MVLPSYFGAENTEANVTKGELDSILTDMRQYIVTTVQQSQQELASNLMETTTTAIKAVARMQCAKTPRRRPPSTGPR